MSSLDINEHATLHAILNIAKTPEEADAMVEYLTTINWQQEFLDQTQRTQNNLHYQIERLLQKLQNGGGQCDQCREMKERLYSWPHDQWGNPYGTWERIDLGWRDKRLCWECLDQAQENAETLLIQEYVAIHGTGQLVMWAKRMHRCSSCGRLVPRKSLMSVFQPGEASIPFVCLHCVEQVSEKQFTRCIVCGKKATNGCYWTARGTICYDCQIAIPATNTIYSHLARARKAGLPATLTIEEWATTVAYFGNKCAYCRHRPFDEIDHFLPLSLGGGTTSDNCVPACGRCNGKKGRKHPDKLCYEVTMFGPRFNTRSDFLPEHIEHIRQYLCGEKQKVGTWAVNKRALVVL